MFRKSNTKIGDNQIIINKKKPAEKVFTILYGHLR